MGAQKNRLIETVLLSTHNLCFRWEIRKLFSCYPLLTKGLLRVADERLRPDFINVTYKSADDISNYMYVASTRNQIFDLTFFHFITCFVKPQLTRKWRRYKSLSLFCHDWFFTRFSLSVGIWPCMIQNGQNYISLPKLQAQQASSTAGLTNPYQQKLQQTPYGKTNNNKLTECPSAKSYTERSITI